MLLTINKEDDANMEIIWAAGGIDISTQTGNNK